MEGCSDDCNDDCNDDFTDDDSEFVTTDFGTNVDATGLGFHADALGFILTITFIDDLRRYDLTILSVSDGVSDGMECPV